MADRGIGRVEMVGVTASIPRGADLRYAEIRVVDVGSGYRVIVGGPLKVFEDLSDLIFTYQREHIIAMVNPENLELHLMGVPRGVRVRLMGTNDTTIKPGMVRILPRKDFKWVA